MPRRPDPGLEAATGRRMAAWSVWHVEVGRITETSRYAGEVRARARAEALEFAGQLFPASAGHSLDVQEAAR
jgi:hypothetical protein